jgi:hypothetical protein
VADVKIMVLWHELLRGLVAGNQYIQMDLILNLYTGLKCVIFSSQFLERTCGVLKNSRFKCSNLMYLLIISVSGGFKVCFSVA